MDSAAVLAASFEGFVVEPVAFEHSVDLAVTSENSVGLVAAFESFVALAASSVGFAEAFGSFDPSELVGSSFAVSFAFGVSASVSFADPCFGFAVAFEYSADFGWDYHPLSCTVLVLLCWGCDQFVGNLLAFSFPFDYLHRLASFAGDEQIESAVP